ncbi:hypothetical protein Rcae01_04057 [Novipirellula caenicola]|uniref:Uncharacterized protein n=2 Tax=Novipirellula caenicola TaxID=1536901 RepID=A0ABP9VTY0_9BACT
MAIVVQLSKLETFAVGCVGGYVQVGELLFVAVPRKRLGKPCDNVDCRPAFQAGNASRAVMFEVTCKLASYRSLLYLANGLESRATMAIVVQLSKLVTVRGRLRSRQGASSRVVVCCCVTLTAWKAKRQC